MSFSNLFMLLADKHATFWFPPKASTFAEETDVFFMYILYISIFFFAIVVGALVWFSIKFRRRPGYRGDSRPMHNNALEITWTVIPTLIVCWIFARGVYGYMDMMRPPADTLDINVTARKWDWSFQYPNGAISDQLHIPNNQAIRLRMRSEDVLHSFYVPAFRAKTDIVPGRVNVMWFRPILEGEYDLFCAEYCGDQHSEMIKRQGVVVHDDEGYRNWVAEAAKPPINPTAHGYWLYERQGCKSCHSVQEGKRIVGPWFTNSFGKTFKNAQGADVKFDEQYIRQSILEPQAQIREGYQNASQMPSFQGKLNEEELISLTAFLQAMSDEAFVAAVADGELSDADKQNLGIADAEAESAPAMEN
jgi:cytochrome c oxidase subunit 2